MTRGPAGPRSNWLLAIRRYLVAIAVGNLLWETAQMPLYTLWRSGTPGAIGQAVVHCTLGDLLIGTAALIAALAAVGSQAWPDENGASVAIATVIAAAGNTVYSEYINTAVRNSWAYTDWMPTLPWLGTGLAPLAQWMVVPTVAFALLRRGASMTEAYGDHLCPAQLRVSHAQHVSCSSSRYSACFSQRADLTTFRLTRNRPRPNGRRS